MADALIRDPNRVFWGAEVKKIRCSKASSSVMLMDAVMSLPFRSCLPASTVICAISAA